MTPNIIDRFWSKVDKTSGCWEWKAGKFSQGYGAFHLKGKLKKAHRVAWEVTNGSIPDHDSYHGICVLHKCDNRGCVNPGHLFLGSQAENLADMAKKGRSNGNPGEMNGNAKLTNIEVEWIKMWLGFGYSQRKIASIFGVSQAAISHIQSGSRWAHI